MTRSLWTYFGRGFVALALIGASFGCGDDDDTAQAAGKGGSSAAAGKGGSSAKAGTSGGGAGKSSVSKDMCKTDTTKAVAAASALTPPACIDCACGSMPDVVDSCDKGCWELITCFATMCPGATSPADQAACIAKDTGPCYSKLATGGKAGMVGAILTGACASTCLPPAPTVDAGTEVDASTPPTGDAGS